MIKVSFPGLDTSRKVNLFAYAANVNKYESQIPNNYPYARSLASEFHKHWSVCDDRDADVWVYPHTYHNERLTNELSMRAKAAGKPMLFLRAGDDSTPAEIPYGTVYRDSIFLDKMTACEAAMPSWGPDCAAEFMENWSGIFVKERAPSVGFCGYVGNALTHASLKILGKQQKLDGLLVRSRCVKALKASPGITFNCISRNRYGGHDTVKKTSARRVEFIGNLFDNPYALCVRGKGNGSVRFYECLSAGRIPVFVNTGCVLPFSNQIDYSKHCVMVEYDEIDKIGEKIQRFHDGLTEAEFVNLQQRNRNLWQECLSPQGFFKRVVTKG